MHALSVTNNDCTTVVPDIGGFARRLTAYVHLFEISMLAQIHTEKLAATLNRPFAAESSNIAVPRQLTNRHWPS